MSDFFHFPHIPHIAWLGEGSPRDDKLLTPRETETLLSDEVVVEEKLDGANLGISLGPDGQLRTQNRGQYLIAPFTGQFFRLQGWLSQHGYKLAGKLKPGIILFGEWCAARHSLDYDNLPDWFLLFDIYDRAEGRFWSTSRRNGLADELELTTVPQLLRGQVTLANLQTLMKAQDSRFRAGPLEGIVIRRENADWCQGRAKLVRAEFTQTLGEHWRGRTLEWNRVQTPSCDTP